MSGPFTIQILTDWTVSHLDIAMGTGDDINALPILFILQDAGIVLGCEDEQQIFAFTLGKGKRHQSHKILNEQRPNFIQMVPCKSPKQHRFSISLTLQLTNT